MKKLFYFISFSFLITSCHSQQEHSVKNATQDDSLTLLTTEGINGGCLFLERPIYYINENYVVYQDCKIRKILYADVSTFTRIGFINEEGLALDKNGVYINGNFVATDTAGFSFLGRNGKDILWKTNTTVYKNTTVLPEIIASEFTNLWDKSKDFRSAIYFKDNQSIYYFDKKVETADLATTDLVYNDSRLFYDKNYMYRDGKIDTFEGEPLFYVNNTLKKTATKVLYQEKVVPNIDVKTLIGLSRNYARDKNNVYCNAFGSGIEILPINKADFKNIKVWDHTNSAYISDGKNLFYYNTVLSKNELDVYSFGTFGFTDFCYDKNGVYTRRYDDKLEKVFYEKFSFKYSDPVSSKNLQITEGSNLYVYYKNQAYQEGTKTLFENLTTDQIELTKKRLNAFRLTKHNGNTVLKTTFEGNLYKIDDAIYYDDKKMSADAATFKRLGFDNYFIDKNFVFKYNREKGLEVLNYIDAETARDFNGFVVDKNYLYSNGTRVIKSDNLEILASYPGYRLGCGLDPAPSSNFYLFRNVEGFWWVKMSDVITVRFLGKNFDTSLSPLFENLEIPKK